MASLFAPKGAKKVIKIEKLKIFNFKVLRPDAEVHTDNSAGKIQGQWPKKGHFEHFK